MPTTENNQWKSDICLKRQWQFAHPSRDTSLKLLISAGNLLQIEKDLEKSVKNVFFVKFTVKHHPDQI